MLRGISDIISVSLFEKVLSQFIAPWK